MALAFAGAIAAAPRAAGACPPSVMLSGPPGDVRQLETLLLRRGVLVGSVGCPRQTVAATVAPSPRTQGLWLHIRDGYGRASVREVADAGTAASLIESWVIGEDADFIAAPQPSSPRGSLVAVSQAATAPASEARWRVLASAEASAGSDGSLWYGAAVGACRVRGATCLGGRARLSMDSGAAANPNSDTLIRTAAEALLVAARPFSLGLITITPVVGVGGSFVRTYDPPTGSGTGTRLDLRLETEASVMATVAITRRWSVVGEVGGSYAGILDRKQGIEDGDTLPAPPALHVRAALGCQYSP